MKSCLKCIHKGRIEKDGLIRCALDNQGEYEDRIQELAERCPDYEPFSNDYDDSEDIDG